MNSKILVLYCLLMLGTEFILQCAKVTMPVLTLARFILEHSLMDYDTIRMSESKLAAAALYMAVRMKNFSTWSPTFEYYSGKRVLISSKWP